MFRLAHISDVHLSPLPKPTLAQLFSKRVLGYLNWKLNRKHTLANGYLERLLSDLPNKNPDHIVVSGDLVNLALPDEFQNAERFLRDLGSPEEVSAICGNHDAYVVGSLKQAIRHWHSFMSSDDMPLTHKRNFPYLRRRGEVAIIGCNSAEATGPFMATGYFRRAQAQRLASILKETKDLCRIVCIHHPPVNGATLWHKRLIGDKRFRKVIAEHGAELVLHGHTHLATTNYIPGPKGNVPVVCVPAAGNGEGNVKPAGRYNLFTIQRNEKRWSVHHEAYGLTESTGRIEVLEEQLL